MEIGIVGLGLIGGSLAHDLHRQHRITGVSRSGATVDEALRLGIIHRGASDWQVLADCELVIVCVPIGDVLSTVAALSGVLKAKAVITDVASVKEAIVASAERLWPRFVGGHPMAGAAVAGLAASRARLFEGRPYVLTPGVRTDPEALTLVEGVVGELGARLLHCSAPEHDRAVARISHLPVFVSAALLLNLEASGDALAASLASSGFFDTTRVGGGNPELGTAMAEGNRAALLEELQRYREQLDRLESAIASQKWPVLKAFLHSALRTREQVFPSQV